jgi:hypothetical protein
VSAGPAPHGDLGLQARLEALARNDKWFLSAGDGFVWAPPFPRWLHRPGFWDPAHIYHYPMAPLYSVALVRADGAADRLQRKGMDWRPDRLRVRWRSRSGLDLTEFRFLLPGGRFCSAWRTEVELGWPNPSFRDLSLVAFTAVPGPSVRDLGREGRGLRWATTLTDRRAQTLDVEAHLTVDVLAPRGRHAVAPEVLLQLDDLANLSSCTALRSEGSADPEWDLTPFVECWAPGASGGAGGSPALEGVSDRGHAHLVVALPLRDIPARHGVGFCLTVAPLEEGASPRHLPPPASVPRPMRAESNWKKVLASYPRFSCSDLHLTRYYDYRLYGLHLNRLGGGRGRIPHPAVAEGIEYFHLPITYSAQCHMWETRWCDDPAVARGSLLNFLAAQRADGSLPGRLYVNHEMGEDFYHANWADAVLAVDALHPQTAFLEMAYGGLAHYADWLLRERDPEASGMITVVNHYETGQEYMSRYLAVDPSSDVTEWEPRLRLKGVDVTVYAYQLLRGLEALALRLGHDGDVAHWRDAGQRTGAAILDAMWDPDAGIFFDVDGANGQRTGVKAAVCFYPLLTDLLDEKHVEGLLAHLRDPATFATTFPVPSSSVDDPLFSAEGLWKGKRHNCPWNGRVWPMTNSHVVEGLLRQWHRGRDGAGAVAAHILSRFVHMMFHRGDPGRANCYEHYNPYTGHACVFRGIDDYQHSWVADLLIRGVTGVEPGTEALRVRPLHMGLDQARFRGRLREHDVAVDVTSRRVSLTVDGREQHGEVGETLEVPW